MRDLRCVTARFSLVKLVNSFSQVEVLFRDSRLAVRRKADAYLVVIDSDVRVVVGLFSGFGDLIHKGDGQQERFESKLPVDRAIDERPLRHIHQPLPNFFFAQCCHDISYSRVGNEGPWSISCSPANASRSRTKRLSAGFDHSPADTGKTGLSSRMVRDIPGQTRALSSGPTVTSASARVRNCLAEAFNSRRESSITNRNTAGLRKARMLLLSMITCSSPSRALSNPGSA